MARAFADLLQVGLLVAAGAALAVLPGRYRRKSQRIHADRLAELDAGADESFFEERRSLEAYPPMRHDRTWRLLGAVLLLFGSLKAYFILTA
jgi:hypothetical protein